MRTTDIHVGEEYVCGRDTRRVVGIKEDPDDGLIVVLYSVAPLRAVFQRTLETFAREVIPRDKEDPCETHDS